MEKLHYLCATKNVSSMNRIYSVWRYICRRKYLIVTVIGIVFVGFVGENSILKHVQNRMQINDMKDEISTYEAQHDQAENTLKELKHNPKAITKIAHERYFMKTDDEDIFVLSDDNNTEEKTDNTSENETTE